MLTKREHKIILIILTYIASSILSPLSWDGKKVFVKRSKKRTITHWIMIFLNIVCIYFNFIRYRTLVTQKEYLLSGANLFIVVTMSGTIAFKQAVRVSTEDLALLFNEVNFVSRRLASAYLPRMFLIPNFREKAVIFIIINFGLTMLLAYFTLYVMLSQALLNYSVFYNPNPEAKIIITQLTACSIVSLILCIDAGIAAIILMATICPTLSRMQFWLRKSSIHWPRSTKLKNKLLKSSVERCILVYKLIQLLNIVNNNAFGRFVVPVLNVNYLLMILTASFCLVSSKSLERSADVIVTGFFITGIVTLVLMFEIILNEFSSLYSTSVKMKNNLTTLLLKIDDQGKRELFLKQINALPNIRSQVGSLYYMEAKAKLRTLALIIRGIVNFIATMKQ